MNDTIFALSTGFVKSAIAIVRVSGENSLNSLYTLTKRNNFVSSKANLLKLYDENDLIIDEAIVLVFLNGSSYTGENLVEYHIHGSIAVIKKLIDYLAKQHNHRLAEKGEFTKRSLLNNKIDVIKAEGILDLIDSETEIQRKQSINQLDGNVKNIYQEIYEKLKNLLALNETMIDFSDQDIDEDFEKKIFEEVKEIHNKLQQATINYKKITKLKKGINIAIIGNTNVGKSSLINYITNEETSIVSKIDGTTRDVINSYIDFEGYPINIMDTAGIRNTRDEIEKIGVHKSKEKAEQSDINILIVDNNNFENSFNTIKEFINEKSIIIVNKIDLENKKYIDEKNINFKNIVYVSILANKNMDNFQQTLLKKIKEIFETKENPIILHERTNNISINCLKYLEDFLNNKNDVVINSYNLKLAINELGKILGYVGVEDILDIIFSKFCIGK